MQEDRPVNDSVIRLTRQQCRAVDRYAIERLGIPGVVLMENAGINAAGAVFDVLRDAFEFEVDEENARIAVVCGGGNNGGDGYVVARQLKCWGMSPVVYAVKRPEDLRGDAKVMAEAWLACGGEVVRADSVQLVKEQLGAWAENHVVVDALLGTGYEAKRGRVREETAAAIAGINSRERRTRAVALDVPSGLDADTGAVVGHAVRADLTVAFVAEKAGFGREVAGKWTSKVVTADIGLPWSVVEAALAELESAGGRGA